MKTNLKGNIFFALSSQKSASVFASLPPISYHLPPISHLNNIIHPTSVPTSLPCARRVPPRTNTTRRARQTRRHLERRSMTFLGTAKRFRTVVLTYASRTTDDIRHASRIPYDTFEATLGTCLRLTIQLPSPVSRRDGGCILVSVEAVRTYGEPGWDGGLGDRFLPVSERQLRYLFVKCHAIYFVADRWIEMMHKN